LARSTNFLIIFPLTIELSFAQPWPTFDAASIKLSKDSNLRPRIEFPPGGQRLIATNARLWFLILTAYDISIPQLSWASSAEALLKQQYDVQAISERPVSRREMVTLLRTLLEDRFHLVLSRETRPAEAYKLVVDKGGPKLGPIVAAAGDEPRSAYLARGEEPKPGHLVFRNESMSDFAFMLSSLILTGNRIVMDKTGIDGRYNFELRFAGDLTTAPPGANVESGPSFFTALREQLGLRLEPQKLPIEFVHIEHATPSSEN